MTWLASFKAVSTTTSRQSTTDDNRSEGVPRDQQKGPVRAILKGDLFLSARSSSFILLSSFFFSHSDSCLKIKKTEGKASRAPRVSAPEREASSARPREHVAQLQLPDTTRRVQDRVVEDTKRCECEGDDDRCSVDRPMLSTS